MQSNNTNNKLKLNFKNDSNHSIYYCHQGPFILSQMARFLFFSHKPNIDFDRKIHVETF